VRPALGEAGRAALAECARRGALLAFDFDGTLAPIVADPDQAALRPATRRLLGRLARRQPCLVLSGRSPSDLRRRLHGIGLVTLVGNHGAAFGLRPAARRAARARASRWRRQLAQRLAGRPGLRLEDNGVSLAVHFRRAPDRAAARRAIRRAIAALPGARALDGKCVVNVLPVRGTHKGDVLRRVARARGASAVLYVGDDLTDEDAFGTRVARRYVTVRVGRASGSLAQYALAAQREIDALLALLLGRG
jgi:trehalose 6-phosphate phosphatase